MPRVYLRFGPEGQGILFAHFTTEDTVVEGLAFFEPRKTIPKFKFTSNGGRSEIIREMSGGTGERRKRYYSGWCSFLKMAKQYDGVIVLLPHDLPKVDIYLLKDLKVTQMESTSDLDNVSVVSVVPSPSSCFAPTMSALYFQEVGNRDGVALTL